MVEYAKAHPEIKRVEISGVLHFGVPPPDDPFYQSKGGYEVVKDDSGLPAYRLTDELLEKNGFVLNRFFREISSHGLEVWFTSSNNPDTDMCRYAKACHFMSADRVEFASNAQLGSAYSRNSFSDLLNELALQPQALLRLTRSRRASEGRREMATPRFGTIYFCRWMEYVTTIASVAFHASSRIACLRTTAPHLRSNSGKLPFMRVPAPPHTSMSARSVDAPSPTTRTASKPRRV